MDELLNVFDLSVFDLETLERILLQNLYFPYSRSCAYAIAKKFRHTYPSSFVRVLKVGDAYFVICDAKQYKDFWEFRKIALRNERKKKNETL